MRITTQKEHTAPAHAKEMECLIAGYKKFRANYFSKNKKSSLYKELAEAGQNPEIMVIACSDSRVDPSIILGGLPGELTENSFITSWMNIANDAKEIVLTTRKDQSLDQQAKACEEQSLLISLDT